MNHTEIVVRCLHCGIKNRIPPDRLNEQPVCGRCGQLLDEIIIPCLACGAKNRLPENRIRERPRCGKCGSPLVLGEKTETIIDLTHVSFAREVRESPGIKVVECWADWCMPCRQLAPVIKELAVRYAGTAHFYTLNVEENPLVAEQYDIRSIPTILIFRDGHLADRLIGLQPKELIEERIAAVIEGTP